MPRGLEFFKNRFSFLNIFKDFNYSKIRLQVDFFKFKFICFTTIPPRNFKRVFFFETVFNLMDRFIEIFTESVL